jgi:hypothetical protein
MQRLRYVEAGGEFLAYGSPLSWLPQIAVARQSKAHGNGTLAWVAITRLRNRFSIF